MFYYLQVRLCAAADKYAVFAIRQVRPEFFLVVFYIASCYNDAKYMYLTG